MARHQLCIIIIIIIDPWDWNLVTKAENVHIDWEIDGERWMCGVSSRDRERSEDMYSH